MGPENPRTHRARQLHGARQAPTHVPGERIGPTTELGTSASMISGSVRRGYGNPTMDERLDVRHHAYQMRWALEYAAAFGEPIGELRAVGGGGIGSAWTQIIADVLERPLHCVRDPQDAAARGAAACALVGIGVEPDLSFARRRAEIDRAVRPVPARAERHRRQYADYQSLYRALAPLFQRTGS
jgi:hypothetical protein